MIVVVPVEPPRDGLVLSTLAETTPLSTAEATRLYEAATMDVLHAVDRSGGDLLVNYRDGETLPERYDDGEPEAEIRALAADVLEDTDEVRFERQVGSTRSARIGNTVSHLLEREDAGGVGVVEPTAALLARTDVDGAAMSLRRNDVVLGPSTGGEPSLACFAEPIDFEDAYAGPALETLAGRSADAGHTVGFTSRIPTLATAAGLRATLAELEARRVTDTSHPVATATAVDDLELALAEDGTL